MCRLVALTTKRSRYRNWWRLVLAISCRSPVRNKSGLCFPLSPEIVYTVLITFLHAITTMSRQEKETLRPVISGQAGSREGLLMRLSSRYTSVIYRCMDPPLLLLLVRASCGNSRLLGSRVFLAIKCCPLPRLS